MIPTTAPSGDPTSHPTNYPSAEPSNNPTKIPTAIPTASSSDEGPTPLVTGNFSVEPTVKPSLMQSASPTASPSSGPTASPTKSPTLSPSSSPTRVESYTLQTTYDSDTDNDGCMFDLKSISTTIKIHSLDLHSIYNGLIDVEVYYRRGTYSGRDKHPGAWTTSAILNGIQGMGQGVSTPLPSNAFNPPIEVLRDMTIGLYVTISNGRYMGLTRSYSNIFSGDIYTSNSEVEMFVGVSKNHLFLHTNPDIIWNGAIHYTALPQDEREKQNSSSSSSSPLQDNVLKWKLATACIIYAVFTIPI